MTKQEAPQLVPVGTVEVRHVRGPERRYTITNGSLDNLPTGTYCLFASTDAVPADARELTVYLDEEMSALLRQTIGDDGDAYAIKLHIGDGHSGWGLYVSLADYPDEGAIQLAAIRSPDAAGEPQGEPT